MSRPRATLLLLAGTLAACDAPTAPPAPPRPSLAVRGAPPVAAPLQLGYATTILPLVPGGINDSGVIVGRLGPNAARYLNGVTTLLPRRTGAAGDHEARAVNQKGTILGDIAGGPGLYWRNALALPEPIRSPYPGDAARPVVPMSVNAQDVVVGHFDHLFPNGEPTERAFRWRPGGAVEDITPPNFYGALALDVNDAGYIAGWGWESYWYKTPIALRWPPNYPAAPVEVLSPDLVAKAYVVGADGFAVGRTESGATWGWSLTGTAGDLSAFPHESYPDDLSGPRRFVGHRHPFYGPLDYRGRPFTYFAGTLTLLPTPPPPPDLQSYVEDLRVNACGSIIGTQRFADVVTPSAVPPVGLLWTKSRCDLVAPAP